MSDKRSQVLTLDPPTELVFKGEIVGIILEHFFALGLVGRISLHYC